MAAVAKHVAVKVALLLAIALLAGCGLTAPRGNEGYADLDSLGVLDVDNTMTLSIGPALLRFAARYLDDEPETQALLRGLDGVRVRIYTVDGDASRVADRMRAMSAKLCAQHWEPVALVQKEGEQVHMLVRSTGGRIHGLTVLALDGDEAVVVNVMGDLKPEYFGHTMAALDVATPPVRFASEEGDDESS